jgi:hypothetical protein
MGLGLLALMLIPSFTVALAADVIDIRTDDSYEPGDSVEVEGSTNVTGVVNINITDGMGHEVAVLTAEPDEDGEFSATFPLAEDAAADTYQVNATIGDIYNITSFTVESDEEVQLLSIEETPEEDVMTVEELLLAIERTFRYMDKLNETAYTLAGEGYDMTLLLDRIEELNGSLEALYNTVDTENLDASIEEFRRLKKEISGLHGLMSSVTKNVKESKMLKFTERMMRRIGELEGNIPLLASEEGGQFSSALQAHEKKLERLQLTLHSTITPEQLENIMSELEGVTQDVESELDELGEEGYTLKQMYKVQAKIDVFNATVERMKEKDKPMNRLEEKLGNANQLMKEMKEQFGELTQVQLKAMVEDAEDSFSGVGKTIRKLNKKDKPVQPEKPDKPDKGSNGTENGEE